MKHLFYLIFFSLNFTLHAQFNKYELASFSPIDSFTLNLEFNSDTTGYLGYTKLGNREESFFFKYNLSNDTVILFNPKQHYPQIYEGGEVSYYNNSSNGYYFDLFISYFDSYSGNIIYKPYSKYSFNGVQLDSLAWQEKVYFKNKKEFPDSIQVNDIWFQIDKSKTFTNLRIYQDYSIVEKPYIDDYFNFPSYFDSLILVRKNKYWSIVKTENLNELDLRLFEKIYPKNWYWRGNQAVVFYNKPHDCIPKTLVTELIYENPKNDTINYKDYPNVKSIYITKNNREHLIFKGPKLDELEIQSDSTMDLVRLNLSQDSIHNLITNTPLKLDGLKQVNKLRIKINSNHQAQILSNHQIPTTCMNIQLDSKITNFVLDTNWGKLNYLLIEQDTINFNCNFSQLPFLDSLILYGYTNNFDFLNCPNKIKYLGIFYTIIADSASLHNRYPNIQQEMWCFHPDNKVNLTSSSYCNLKQLSIGDSILARNENGTLIQSKVIGIEYHFNVNSKLIKCTYNNTLAGNSTLIYPAFNVQFTPNHPLNYLGESKLISDLKFDDYIPSIYGNIPYYHFDQLEYNYSGTLINILTEDGNYFINDMNFLNK